MNNELWEMLDDRRSIKPFEWEAVACSPDELPPGFPDA